MTAADVSLNRQQRIYEIEQRLRSLTLSERESPDAREMRSELATLRIRDLKTLDKRTENQ